MNKCDKNKFLKNFSKWEESKAIGKADLFVTLAAIVAIGCFFGVWA